MKYLITLLFFTTIFAFQTFSQKLEDGQLVQIESSPSKKGILNVHIYSAEKKLCDIWELQTFVQTLRISDYNKLLSEGSLVPHGEHIHYADNVCVQYRENYKDGILHGQYESFYPSGEKHISCTFSENAINGTYNEFAENGNLVFTTQFKNSRKNGIEKAFYPDGNKKYSVNYIHGILDGKVEAFHENSTVKYKATYANGKVLKQKCFDADKNKIDCEDFATKLSYPSGIKTIIAELNNISIETSLAPKHDFFYIQIDIDQSGEIERTKIIPEDTPINEDQLQRFFASLKAFAPPKINGEAQSSSLYVKVSMEAKEESNFKGNIRIQESYTFDYKSSKLRYSLFNDFQDQIFFFIENMPEFPGGEQALRSTIAQNIRYPVEAQRQGISGKVYVSFVVNEVGDVTDIKIAKGVSSSINREAIRVVSNLPKWKPGIKDGVPVKVSYTVPINFMLSKPLPNEFPETNFGQNKF